MAYHGRERKSQDFYDVHHVWWPRSAYRGNLEARFRNLACFKIRMPRSDHNLIHRTGQPPEKPSREDMLRVLDYHKARQCPVCYPMEVTEDERGEPGA